MIPRKYLILVAMSGLLVSLDQLTKFLVSSRIDEGRSHVVVPDFLDITLVYNTGAAFGLFANLPPSIRDLFFFFVPGLTLLLVMFAFTRLHDKQQLSIFSLSLIVGGALGNLMDRLRLDRVVDFVALHWREAYHFPAFNLADSAITVGVFLLLVGIISEKESSEGLR